MSTFKEQIDTDLKDSFFNINEFATTAVYTPAGGGTSVDCNVIIDHDILVQMDGYEAGVMTVGTVIEALYVDVEKPAKDSVFVVDGSTTYKVRGIESCDKITTRCKVIATN